MSTARPAKSTPEFQAQLQTKLQNRLKKERLAQLVELEKQLTAERLATKDKIDELYVLEGAVQGVTPQKRAEFTTAKKTSAPADGYIWSAVKALAYYGSVGRINLYEEKAAAKPSEAKTTLNLEQLNAQSLKLSRQLKNQQQSKEDVQARLDAANNKLKRMRASAVTATAAAAPAEVVAPTSSSSSAPAFCYTSSSTSTAAVEVSSEPVVSTGMKI